MLEQLMETALAHIHLHAIEALDYSEAARVEWVPGYWGRYAAVWIEGDRGSLSVWELEALGFGVSHCTISCDGKVSLWGRRGSGRYQMGLNKLCESLSI